MRGGDRRKRHISAQFLLVTLLSGILLPSLAATETTDAASETCPMHGISCTCPEMCIRRSSQKPGHDMNSSTASASCHTGQHSGKAHTNRHNSSLSFEKGCGPGEGATLIGENRPIIVSGITTLANPFLDPILLFFQSRIVQSPAPATIDHPPKKDFHPC